MLQTKQRLVYFLGHERALCPVSLQIPHSLGLFAGGALVSESVGVEEEVAVAKAGVVVEVVVVVVAVVEVPVPEEVLVAEDDEVAGGSGSAGLGQVIARYISETNSAILRNRYHCRWRERPLGMTSSGRSVAVGVQECLSRSYLTSGESDLSLTNTDPLCWLEKRRWVKRFNSYQLVQVLSKKGLPVVGGDDDSAVW